MKKMLVFFALIMLIISGCVVKNKNQEQQHESVKLQLKWFHQAQFAGNYVAKEKGFYNNKGMDVEIIPYDFEKTPIEEVSKGNAEFGIAGAEEVIIAQSQGYPIKAVAVVTKINPHGLLFFRSTNITTPKDLVGRTILIDPSPTGNTMFYYFLKTTGIDKSELNLVPINYSKYQLYDKEADVIFSYVTSLPKKNKDLNFNPEELDTMLLSDYGSNIYSDVIIVNENLIEENPKLITDFLSATLEGWKYAITNEDEAVNITLKYMENGNREAEEYMLKKFIPLIHTGDSPIGMMEKKEWEGAQRILFEQKFIKSPVGPKNIYDMRFLNEIYNLHEDKNIVPVKLAWLHQNQFAGFYVADQLGYYKEKDIYVELDSAGYGLPIDERVVNGESLFGVMDSGDFIKSVSKGNKLKAVAAVFKQDPVVFISLKEKNITTPHDLRGKTIAFSLSIPERVKLVLKNSNINESEVNFVQKEYSINSLYHDDVDVLVGVAFNELSKALEQGLDVNFMSAEELGIESYYNILFTSEELIEKNPELVEKFVKATLKGWEYVIENPKQSSNFVLQYDTGLNTYEQERMLDFMLEYIKNEENDVMGLMKQEMWQKTYDSLYSIGEISNPINVKDIFTNEFVD